jgi:hypothetical protein
VIEKTIIRQKLKKVNGDGLQLAERYYQLISTINSLKLTDREIQLVAFTAVKGNISYANVRQEFCEKYKTSNATINNIISKLKKVGVLVKEGSKIKVNPVIVLDFEKDVILEINLIHGQTN